MSDDYSIDYQAIEQARVFTIIIASISVLFPLSVVFILIQNYNTLVRGKSLVHYVLCIAIADTMTAISSIWLSLCWYRGMLYTRIRFMAICTI